MSLAEYRLRILELGMKVKICSEEVYFPGTGNLWQAGRRIPHTGSNLDLLPDGLQALLVEDGKPG